ncbi:MULTISPECIES: acyl-CoA dehydrogenase [unclassified Vibrio]|uniref:Acyl-coenzyme A dehydrogenase n=1 Tax=Vibrio sp. HB236076 TaxID=3232307 RepID=A0AB39HCR7_9VIBR|nr:acyl-CoA dehydrogenase [Vibrio sp. HB161653]MDP5253599.1 acyl-CoA dehydrogenase [Vibrio sp. HB161653]
MNSLRKKWVSDPALTWFKKTLPALSTTEREAMEAGSVWWEGELFSGQPDFSKLHNYPKPTLSEEEKQFIENQLPTLMDMLDDHQIIKHDRNLPEAVWQYLKQERFFSLIIPKEYGGRAFSALANSTIVSTIATKSISAAVTVMVPNSLGPGELLTHYGTEEQKNYWLPRLADGQDIPCFALTGPEAGSDAGGILDSGEVCYGTYQGKKTLGINLNWNKRYITLAPVATVLGLAFKLSDPQHLLGDKTSLGITCALIPTSHDGVEIGERHDPLGLAFMNGPTRGENVFIPMDWLIGGQEYAGKGWRMLVECLSAGRGISLPAIGAAIGHLTTRTTPAYGYVRKQFGMPIGQFEGVEQVLGKMAGLTYLLEATRTFTTTALDMGEKPGIVTAIAKYHMTEIGREILNDAMDIHAGRAIQDGPMNYLATHYIGIPVAITVEGANILTRNLMIFGQGATRCHPYVLKEMEAAANPDTEQASQAFDQLLFKHIGHASKNALLSCLNALTASRFAKVECRGEVKRYYQHIKRLSQALSIAADVSMLTLGGDLKRKEATSARLGDTLSYLFMATACLKKYQDEGAYVEDRPLLDFAVQHCLHNASHALNEAYRNFPKKGTGKLLKHLTFPLGNHCKAPSDGLVSCIARLVSQPGEQRDRLTHLCYVNLNDQGVGLMERSFIALKAVEPLEKKLHTAIKQGDIPNKISLAEKLELALKLGVFNADEVEAIEKAEALRQQAIQVDHFSHDFSEIRTHGKPKNPTLNDVA